MENGGGPGGCFITYIYAGYGITGARRLSKSSLISPGYDGGSSGHGLIDEFCIAVFASDTSVGSRFAECRGGNTAAVIQRTCVECVGSVIMCYIQALCITVKPASFLLADLKYTTG